MQLGNETAQHCRVLCGDPGAIGSGNTCGLPLFAMDAWASSIVRCDAGGVGVLRFEKQEEYEMHGAQYYLPMKIVGYVVLSLMLLAICWAGYITLTHWAGIGV